MSRIINGYALVNGDVADISAKGDKAPLYERIRPGALIISPDLYIDGHHSGALSTFAFAKDRTLGAVWDSYGLRFEATLPDTTAGRDVYNALARDGLRVGVSVEFANATYEMVDGMREIMSGTLTAINLMKPGHAHYRRGGVWMADAAPDSIPRDLRVLQGAYRIHSTVLTPAKPVAKAPAMRAPATKVREDADFEAWYREFIEGQMTLADVIETGFKDDVVHRCRERGLR